MLYLPQRTQRTQRGMRVKDLKEITGIVVDAAIKIHKEIGAEVMDEVAEKVRRLKVAAGVSVRTALVYDGCLSPCIEAEHCFDVLVPASRLLQK